MDIVFTVISLGLLGLAGVALFDLFQRRHSLLRIYPIVGRLRYLLESVGPELRQYIVTNNNEERPFSRDQRRWIYASAKQQNDYFGFGTDNALDQAKNHILLRHSTFPLEQPVAGHPLEVAGYPLPCAKQLGAARGRRRAFRPASLINISGMSYGALGGPAVAALNQGARLAGCLQNTGEGGISQYHQQGGDLILQIGTGYFGCRDDRGRFHLGRLRECLAANPQVKALEIKLSQGAKPGLGGMLPGAKVTAEIALARGVPVGQNCVSPATHSAFSNVDSMLDFVERLGDETGLPVGIKSAVGERDFWADLARQMDRTERGVDFITIDGGEGGTGAAPLAFSDHVALTFRIGFSEVYRVFLDRGLADRIVFIGSGRLGLPEEAMLALIMGCDMVHLARETMLSIGCIQAQECHTGQCPTGITTHHPWRTRGIDPELKGVRAANYIIHLRKELIRLSRACGQVHPALVGTDRCQMLDAGHVLHSLEHTFGYEKPAFALSEDDRAAIAELMERPELPAAAR